MEGKHFVFSNFIFQPENREPVINILQQGYFAERRNNAKMQNAKIMTLKFSD